MGRKPTDLGADAEAQIAVRMARGESLDTIHQAFPEVSRSTIARRMAKRRPEVNAARAPALKAPPAQEASSEALPSTPDEIPADASLELLEHYRRLAKASIDAASDEGDLKLVAQLINMAGGVEDRIKARQPRAVEDPNDQPDMRRLGGEVMERMLKAVDLVLEET